MIALLEDIAPQNTVLSGYLEGYYEAYGAKQSFLQFYGNKQGGQLAVLDGTATVCWHEEDREELFMFLSARSDIHAVRTDIKTGVALADYWGANITIRPVMKCEKKALTEQGVTSVSPRKLYVFLANIFSEMPPFEPWYLDVSHRLRHGFCHICAVECNEEIVSSAMTVAEWKNGAVIGAVATDDHYRGKGFASLCVRALTAEMQNRGKTVYISPKTEKAKQLYERLGFSVCEELAILERT